MQDTGDGRTIKSVDVVCKLITELRDTDEVSVTELADVVDRSPGTVSTYLTTLKGHGFVVKSDDGYTLGPEFLTFGEYVRHNFPLYQAAKDEIDELVEVTGECAHLIIEHRGRIYTLYENFGTNAVGVEYHNRKRETPLNHIHCTAAGKSILAHLPERRAERILRERGLTRNTDQTITEFDRLLDELETVRNRGYSFADEEQLHGLRAVGAPVLTQTGTVVGAITVSGPTSRLRGDWFESELPERVMQAANIAELNLEAQDDWSLHR